ncbi:hypothetical protein CC86DRAFT_412179 [Ophiobolus disseminans]|uniref:BTB domain-containing protein n=1 Tax=Ophiobolus disseminans TaxID=1469910 RepID=A0A6A6ZHT5_9PLEO|nr:hypothetical protein CC86DRAFT_412179 [Ophiobolus disseminans]
MSPSPPPTALQSSRAFEAQQRHPSKVSCISLSYRPAPASFDTQIRIKVLGNNTSTSFSSFRGVLSSASGYFARALSGRWATNNGDEVEIEDDAKIFQYFVNFAHTGSIVDGLQDLDVEYVLPNPAGGEVEWPVALHDDAYEGAGAGPKVSFDDLVELYGFADRRDVPALSDCVVSVMLEKIAAGDGLPVETLERLLTKTVAGKNSLMFQMLVEIGARCVDLKDFEEYMDDVPKEYMLAVLGRQREIVLHDQLTAEAERQDASQASWFDNIFGGQMPPYATNFPYGNRPRGGNSTIHRPAPPSPYAVSNFANSLASINSLPHPFPQPQHLGHRQPYPQHRGASPTAPGPAPQAFHHSYLASNPTTGQAQLASMLRSVSSQPTAPAHAHPSMQHPHYPLSQLYADLRDAGGPDMQYVSSTCTSPVLYQYGTSSSVTGGRNMHHVSTSFAPRISNVRNSSTTRRSNLQARTGGNPAPYDPFGAQIPGAGRPVPYDLFGSQILDTGRAAEGVERGMERDVLRACRWHVHE